MVAGFFLLPMTRGTSGIPVVTRGRVRVTATIGPILEGGATGAPVPRGI